MIHPCNIGNKFARHGSLHAYLHEYVGIDPYWLFKEKRQAKYM